MAIGGDSCKRFEEVDRHVHDEVEFVDFSPFKNVSLPKPANLPEPMWGPVADLVDGRVIVCGGRPVGNCYIYSMEDNTWRKTVSLDRPREYAVEFVLGDSWYILGGRDTTTDPFTFLNSTLVYTDGDFRPGPDIPHSAYGACITPVNYTHFFFAGGFDGSEYDDAYLLEVDGWKWTKLGSLHIARSFHSCGRSGNQIVVVGGCNSEVAGTTSEIFSLDSHTWTIGPGVPLASHGNFCSSAVYQLEDTFYLLGGGFADYYLDTVFEFDREFFKWQRRKERLATERENLAIVPIPNSILGV